MANRGSEHNKLSNVLRQKMRSPANDYHYAAKYWLRFNPIDSDNTFLGNATARVILLPILLPYWFWNRRKKQSEMREFVVAGTNELAVEPPEAKAILGGDGADIQATSQLAAYGITRELLLKWVELHPRDFPLGEYDPKVAKLQRTFGEILSDGD